MFFSIEFAHFLFSFCQELNQPKELLKNNSFKFDAEILFVFEAKNISIALATVSFFNEKDG